MWSEEWGANQEKQNTFMYLFIKTFTSLTSFTTTKHTARAHTQGLGAGYQVL